MTAQQQEPTMREEIAAAVLSAPVHLLHDSGRNTRVAAGLIADAVLAVLERRGDDDAARGKRIREWVDGAEDIGLRTVSVESVRRALDGDDTGSGQ